MPLPLFLIQFVLSMQHIKEQLNIIIFGTDTKAGKRFDVVLLWLIILSVFIVIIESVPEIGGKYAVLFNAIEWVLTILFSIEYLLRIWVTTKTKEYVFSFWGIIDFLSVVPTYLSLLLVGVHYLVIVRSLRLLRVFRILKLTQFSSEAAVLATALKQSRHKISVFLLFVVLAVFVMGTMMYVVEGETNGFKSIPESIYWSIVTITTVGYGDIVPKTFMGKFISSVMMIIGYAIIAIPTGIVSMEMSKAGKESNHKKCVGCTEILTENAQYCSQCGEKVMV